MCRSRFHARTAHPADSYAAVFALVQAGYGISLVPRMAAADRIPGPTVRVPRAQQPSRQVSLFVRQAAELEKTFSSA